MKLLNVQKNINYIQPQTISLNESGLDFQVAFGKDKHGVEWVLRLPRRPDVYKRTKPENNGRLLTEECFI